MAQIIIYVLISHCIYLFILDLKSNECHSCMVCIDEFAVGGFSI